jgi:hypothetical protein
VLDFPASPAEGAVFHPPATGLNAFNYASGKWRQDRGWVHLFRGRNIALPVGGTQWVHLPPGYSWFKLLIRRFEPVGATTGIAVMRMSVDNGATVIATGYVWQGTYQILNTPASWYQDQWTGGPTYIPFAATTIPAINNGGPNMYDIEIDPGGNSICASYNIHSGVYAPGQGFAHTTLSGYANSTQTGVTHLMFYYVDYPPTTALQSNIGAYDLFGAP